MAVALIKKIEVEVCECCAETQHLPEDSPSEGFAKGLTS